MNNAQVENVIVCTNATLGDGSDFTSPVRRITEVYTLDGRLIAMSDPLSWSIEDIKAILQKMISDEKINTGQSAKDMINIYFDDDSRSGPRTERRNEADFL